ncbi:ATP-binding protein [Streptomyces sp. NBC_01304]|uniref:ATP-binding protein n=1 Tax=Streptomyces sp. NBC_01304 TaxID=2903818 RepID=UPI002E0E4548|nr:ATP-binding protein [Streptomyces sp. NBC_01304]
MPLRGRESELSGIAELTAAARQGHSGTLVLRGDPGIGKTALLDHAASEAADLVVLRAAAVEAESQLPFATLQLLLTPALRHLDAIPAPQRDALRTALGLAKGDAPEPMLIGLAVLSLLAEARGQLDSAEGLLCLVDDAHWLDAASRGALLFAARRLQSEGVALLFAAREGEGSFDAPGLPELRLTGLPARAAGALLDERSADLTPTLRYRVLAEAHGNPLALLELPVALAAESPGAAPGALPLTSRLELAFHGRVSRLPDPTRLLLLLAAADGTGSLAVVLHAAAAQGIGPDALHPAEQADPSPCCAPPWTGSAGRAPPGPRS